MRKWIFTAAVLSLATVGVAKGAVIKSYADFFAPSVYDKSSYTNSTSVGAIVYDTSDDKFYGKDATNAWSQLNPTPPPSLGFVGSIKYANTVSWSGNNNGYQAFSATSVGSPVITQGLGTCSQPSTGIPAIKCSLPAGTYRVEAIGWFEAYTSGQPSAFNFYDGTSSAQGENGIYPINAGSQLSTMPTIVGYFTYATAQSNITIEIRGGGIGASGLMTLGGNTSTLIRVVREL